MPSSRVTPVYRHHGVALLRAAVMPLDSVPDQWPDPFDTPACREWLVQVWDRTEFAAAVRQASPDLAARVDAIRAGRTTSDKHVRRAAASIARYLLRAAGRPTPFGLFAGVARAGLAPAAAVRWGTEHRAVARPDTQWLAAVLDRLEACPDLLERLEVVFSNLAVQRGGRLHLPHGPNRVTIAYSAPVRAVRESAAVPIRFEDLADKLAADFGPGTDRAAVRRMLTELVRQGFLITSLRAPFTVTDPLAHCLDRLRAAGAEDTDAAELLHALQQVAADLARPDQITKTARRMRRLSPAGRTPLAVDLTLDCDVSVPHQVADEMCRAATALMRLTRFPTGQAVWRAYHAAFCHRYGTGALVPVLEVVNPDTGLGFPAAYPGSVLPEPADVPTARDERLLSLAWQAKTGDREIVLTDGLIRDLTAGDRFTERNIPPHVELSARIHAPTLDALDRGDYMLTVAPARSAGTLTSRFTPLATGTGLEDLYRTVPTGTKGALPVQMSFPPVYSHAENVCRIPAYLGELLPLGEHRAPAEGLVGIEDLAVTATRDRLYLVSISRHRVVDTQVFHALALEKQPPPLARFLAHLPRAFTARWHEFDWGPLAGRLPFLPRIRYGRTVLHPARWRPDTTQLPLVRDLDVWRRSLEGWRHYWNCPETVELRDADRTLRLTLAEPSHAATLYDHLKRHGHALLYEAPDLDAFGWIGGHTHEIAVPLTRTAPAAPSPLRGALPVITNRSPGHLPGAAGTRWLYAQVFAHPEQHDDIFTTHLPGLLDALEPHVGEPVWWFVRYRSPQETDHLRFRFRVPTQEVYGACATAVGAWAARLLDAGMAGDLRLGTYWPEVGRYGTGTVMEAAEAVFAADSRLVCAELQAPSAGWYLTARVALSMVDIAAAFLGDLETAVRWLVDHPSGTGEGADREVVDQVVRAARDGHLRTLPDAPDARQVRADALAAYRRALPETADLDEVLGSLLHMHHNRALGIDPDGESVCRRLARQAALAHRAATEGDR